MLSRLFMSEEGRQNIAIIILGIVAGMIIGSLQQLLLRRMIKINGMYWVIATTVGITMYMIVESGLYTSYISQHFPPSSIARYGFYAASGLVLGISQWLVLRQNYIRSEWWILATTLSFPISTMITSFFYNQLPLSVPMRLVTNILVTITIFSLQGLCYGVATWLASINIASKPGFSLDENIQVRPLQ